MLGLAVNGLRFGETQGLFVIGDELALFQAGDLDRRIELFGHEVKRRLELRREARHALELLQLGQDQRVEGKVVIGQVLVDRRRLQIEIVVLLDEPGRVREDLVDRSRRFQRVVDEASLGRSGPEFVVEPLRVDPVPLLVARAGDVAREAGRARGVRLLTHRVAVPARSGARRPERNLRQISHRRVSPRHLVLVDGLDDGQVLIHRVVELEHETQILRLERC